MKQESLRIEGQYRGRSKPRPVKSSLTSVFVLILRLLFYKPIWTEETQNHHNIRFVSVDFSAWHFAGSDLLWAGLAIRLFQALQINFGKLQLVLYRVAQHNEEEEIKKKVGSNFCQSQSVTKTQYKATQTSSEEYLPSYFPLIHIQAPHTHGLLTLYLTNFMEILPLLYKLIINAAWMSNLHCRAFLLSTRLWRMARTTGSPRRSAAALCGRLSCLSL